MLRILALTLAMLLAWPGTRGAAAEPAGMAAALQQVTLTHRLVKFSCLMMKGAGAPIYAEQITSSADALGAGWADLADHAIVVPDRTMARGDIVLKSARQIGAGDFHSVPVSLLLEAARDVSHDLMQMSAQTAAPAHLGTKAEYYRAVLLARAASQALQRDMCLIATGLASDQAQALFADRVAAFEVQVHGLLHGDAARGLQKAPDIHVKVTLGKIQSKWKTLLPLLTTAADGAAVALRDVQLASVLGDAILANFDHIATRLDDRT